MLKFDPSIPYEEMKRKLIEACDSYYNKSFSTMTDAEFDSLKDEFRELWPDDPFLKTIGAPVPESSEWAKVAHKIEMYSCNKVNTLEEFEKWVIDNGIYNEDFITSEKLDGISLSIDYEDGKLIKATTRGDGKIGEDITPNVLRMQNVKSVLPIPYTGTLRAEIMMKHSDFNAVNFICKTRGEREYQNVRNGASGIAKGYDGKYTEYLYVEYYFATGFKTKLEIYDFIEKELQLKTCKHYFGNIETVKLVYNEYEQSIRAGLDHDIDGLVIEPNNIEVLERLGKKGENLRGQIAWKFSSEKARTRLLDIECQLGDSKRLTPVAILETVELNGVKVSRASLHNYEMFMKLSPYKGAVCIVSRRNDVIPYIEEIFKASPGTEVEYFKLPDVCPVCGKPTKVDGVYLVCNNEECSGGEIGNINKWLKKLELKGIASATVEKLYNAGLIKTPADLYKLRPEMICELDGFGSSSANKIVETINSKKELTFEEFIGGLNIPNFSGKTAVLLEKNGYDTPVKLMKASVDELAAIKGIGLITAKEIIKGTNKKQLEIFKLLESGVVIKMKSKSSDSSNPFYGKKVVFTGALNIKRKEAQEMVEKVGGSCPSSIGKDTDYLVIADINSTSSKAQKARDYGTKLLSEEQFMELINS